MTLKVFERGCVQHIVENYLVGFPCFQMLSFSRPIYNYLRKGTGFLVFSNSTVFLREKYPPV